MDEEEEIRRLQQQRRVKSGELSRFGVAEDDETSKSNYMMSIDVGGGNNDNGDDDNQSSGLSSFTAPKRLLESIPGSEPEGDVFDAYRTKTVQDTESSYQKRRLNTNRGLSPDRVDPFAQGMQKGRKTFKEAMEEVVVEREEKEVARALEKKMKEQEEQAREAQQEQQQQQQKKRSRRWDVKPEDVAAAEAASQVKIEPEDDKKRVRTSDWDEDDSGSAKTATSRWGETPKVESGVGAFGETPKVASGATTSGRRSRWDETPQVASGAVAGATPIIASGTSFGETPVVQAGSTVAARIAAEIEWRNRPITDQELNELLPREGYIIVEPPASYKPIRTPARKLTTAPSPFIAAGGFSMGDGAASAQHFGVVAEVEGLPIRPEERQYFQKLIDGKTEENAADATEAKEIRIMKLLLVIKNGTPPMRKKAFRSISENARNFGAGPLFAQILPLLLSPTLDPQERHLLVKTIDRVLYRLDDLVRPYVHKILVVIQPLLIDESNVARAEAREIISNLAKAAGLATMISTMRPDIDHQDDFVRNTTARAFAVVGSALGVSSLIPFLKAVCRSKKSWQARHTGARIIQQLAMLLGCGILPHLKLLVECMAYPEGGLQDDQQPVRTATALALASLAEASAPYGIESFDVVLKDLYYGIRKHRGKSLAAFLKAIGYMLPLMDASIASFYVREVMIILIREFASPEDEMKRIVLRVVQQAVSAEGVTPQYVREEILPDFFKHFWTRRMALEKRNYREVVDATVHMSSKVGCSEIVGRICDYLKDESEPFRKMVAECIHLVVSRLGTADIDANLEKRLIDGLIFSFQAQVGDDSRGFVDAFGTVVVSLGERMKVYLSQLAGVLKWLLDNKTPKIRQNAALLIGKIAPVMTMCDEEKLLNHLSLVLFEYLGEEYPDVLASILGALKAIVNVVGMERIQPPIRDLLPRLTPILRNRQEQVQENVVDLVGRIADRGGSFVAPKEWMRICYELIDLLKAHKKAIRRAAVSTFGYIAKSIGPSDVLVTLLNNLKVQDRQNRVCTTVAIAIVAEQCMPFTVLPGLMNEYKIPDKNVQNGVLKALSFMFEYIGSMASDYINAVTPLLEHALIDRDAVHRQTAASVIKHISIGVHGLSCEDCLQHLLNYLWPNVFETSPHVINAVLDGIEGTSLAIGPARVLQYTWAGLFHPARKVRAIYWKIFNQIYYNFQDRLVACFPSIPDEPHEGRQYERRVLDIMI